MKKLFLNVRARKEKLKNKENENGQALVEFALVLPILILIICGILDFGWLFYNQLSLDNACREGARYAAVNSLRSDAETVIEEYVNNAASNVLTNDLDVTVTFTDNNNKDHGDVIVSVSTTMNIMTPVLGVINGGQTRVLTSRVIMKVES